ncbi:SWIM-type domain-containing protein [Citrus sinensis]|uniref:SWIM-type domain-containing protein n=1 Tax=Citrus sinensis TaxID=2711 RepID=A0ACB8LXT2_CITSI|nr:SWIM-type domain-containing protein [Citrus sinensis]
MHVKTDFDLQDALKKLKQKSYSWALFIIRTELDVTPISLDHNENEETPSGQFPAPQVSELDWFDFAEVNEFALPDLNAEIRSVVGCSAATAEVKNSVEEIEGNEDNDSTVGGFVNTDDSIHVLDHENNAEEVESDVSDDEFNFNNEDEWDARLDAYEFGDDSGADSDGEDENIQAAACRYEANSGGFEFTPDGDNIILRIGQLFKTVDEFRNVVKVFAIKNGFRLKRVKNEKSRVTMKCSASGCTWRIHASPNWNKKHFQIKTHLPEHTCERNIENYEANSTWIAATFLHLFRANTEVPIDVLGSELFRNYGIKCCNQRLYRAKNKALELLGQDHKASFTKLFRYMHAILASNPGSTVSLEKDWLGGGVNPHFKIFFVFFDACRRGFFEGCRQFIGIDGCHLKGLYKGVLLSAVSVDANYGIYPLAMCVVETENTESWVYFMEKLYDQVGCNDGEGLCFMSDRQKGILNALDRVFPRAMRRYCCRHVYANFKLKFPRILLRNEFWAACRSGNQVEFNNHMAKINSISHAAHRWLLQIPSFNNWISSFRGMPIVRMLEEIRRKIMILIHKRHELVNTWQDELPPLVRRRVMEARVESRALSVIFGHNKSFEVMENVSKRCVVDLGSKHCDCGEWDISGLPCKHAMCCIDALMQ